MKFRPQERNKIYDLKHRRKWAVSYCENWSMRSRLTLFPGVYNIGSYLHYLADHAPEPIQKRWKPAFLRFCKRYRKF